jgi:protein tyrosine phosphatase
VNKLKTLLALSCLALLSGCATAAVPSKPAKACAQPMDANIENSCVVAPQVLWRGAKPDGLAAASLIERGVKTVVNLELLHDDLKTFESAKLSSSQSYQLQYFRVADWEPLVALSTRLVDDHVAHFIAITRSQPKPIYVHCRSGRNRTGVMVAAYNVFNGMPIEDAVADMQRYNGEWFVQDAKYIRSLNPQHKAKLESKIAAWIPKLKSKAEISCVDASCKAVKN